VFKTVKPTFSVCEWSGPKIGWSGAWRGRGRKRSRLVWERKVPERERSGEWTESAAHSPPNLTFH